MGTARTGVVAMATAVFVVVAAVPCWACSCIARTDAEHYEAADVVFTGHATGRRDTAPPGPMQNSADPIVWTFHVQSVQKGRAAENQEVSTTRDEASCGIEFVVGRRYQVFARAVEGGLHTGLCDGTRQISEDAAPYAPAAATPRPTAPPPVVTPEPTIAPAPTLTPTASPSPTPSATPLRTPLRTADSGFPSPVPYTANDRGSSGPAVAVFLAALGALGGALALARRGSGGA